MTRETALAPEFRLLCLIARPSPDASEVSRAVAAVTDWRALQVGIRHHRLIPQARRAFQKAAAGGIPATFQDWLRSIAMAEAAWCHRQESDLLTVATALDAAGVAHLVLKGTILAVQLYDDRAARGSGDIDLLVSPHQVHEADDVLRSLGYARKGVNILDYTDPRQRDRIKDVVYLRDDTAPPLELHQRLFENPWLLQWDFQTLWDRRETVRIGAAQVPTISPDALPVYLAVHGAHHCWERLRWVADLADCLRHAPESLAMAMDQADKAGVGYPMRQGIALGVQWLGLPLEQGMTLRHDTAPLVRRFFMGDRWRTQARRGSLEWLRRYSFWGRVQNWSLRGDWRYRWWEVTALLIWPTDWQTVRLPSSLFWLYPLLRPVAWVLRRWRN